MNATKREFIIKELMVERFIESSSKVIRLEETEDTGKSELEFQVMSNENLIIKNVDKKIHKCTSFKRVVRSRCLNELTI